MRATLALVTLLAACGAQKDYADRAEVVKVQKERGFVRLGTFGKASGPLTVVEERTARETIRFTLANGTSHTYPGYTGYTLKLLRLEDGQGKETVLVFRSDEKS